MHDDARILLVTGGSRGIGRAVCRLGARRGYRVVFSYRSDAGAAADLVAAIEAEGGSATTARADVSQPAEVAALFDVVDRQPGRLAGLVNNAGTTGRRGPFMEADAQAIRAVFETNFFGLLACTREAVARMSTARGGRGGAIVNLSSGAAQTGAPNAYVWYGASKAAVDTFTIGLARETAGEGIRVNGVAPGVTDTGIHEAAGAAPSPEMIARTIPMGRMATPEEIAEPILWLLSEAASYVTGSVLRVGGGR